MLRLESSLLLGLSVETLNSKHWLEGFLAARGLTARPDGRPLYKYNVSLDEYGSLRTLMSSRSHEASHALYSRFWSAAFCLFVAEKYRREYDGSQGGWSWQGFDNEVGRPLSPQEHSQIVRKGMAYWQRPIRERLNGSDYLGTLFADGGLPWKLLQTDRHGFGRAVSGGLRKYYRNKYAGRDLISVIREYESYFPEAFKNTQTLLLIASIIECLIHLAEAHALEGEGDPAAHLDKHDINWRKNFPIPIGEENARILVNEWLINAGRSRRERKAVEEEAKGFSCLHRLKGNLFDWQLESEVFLPRRIEIPLNEIQLQSVRLELVFFEGEERIGSAGFIYAKLDEPRNMLIIELPKLCHKLQRQHPEQPLMLHLLSNGLIVQVCYFEGSDIDWETLPLIFEDREERLLVGTASTVVAANSALIRMPEGAYLEESESNQGNVTEVGADSKGGRWIRVSDEVVMHANRTLMTVRLNGQAVTEKLSLKGYVTLYDCLPKLTYQGWPTLHVPEGVLNQFDSVLKLCANGQPVLNEYQRSQVGTFNMSVLGGRGETVLRRKVGVLPSSFSIKTVPSSNSIPARIIIRSEKALQISIRNRELISDVKQEGGQVLIDLKVPWNQEPPETVVADIFDGRDAHDPVTIRLPFPQRGYRLFSADGELVSENMVSLDDLLGMRLVLTASSSLPEYFFLVIELNTAEAWHLKKYYRFVVHQYSENISLYSFHEDIQQMLASVPDQDASIKLSVETDQLLGQFHIKRYGGAVKELDAQGVFEIEKFSQVTIADGVKPLGMRLSEPAAAPVDIPEKLSQGVGMGLFNIPEKMRREGPWLIYPASDSSIKFRPIVWATLDGQVDDDQTLQSNTIHQAAKLFHPIHNRHVFDNVVEEMAEDISHSGWLYFIEMQKRYSHLPLSAFESWQALNTNGAALALAVFRLESDESFCRKLTNELSVIWESITIDTWLMAQRIYKDYLIELGLPVETVSSLVEQRQRVLADKVPVFRHLERYMNSQDESSLQAPPLELVLPGWYNELRRRQADNKRWPENLSAKLTHWMNRQEYPENIKRLSESRFSHAVTYLPIFMAHVTAGKASLNDLSKNIVEVKFGIHLLSDFDREGWYEPVYSTVLTNLLGED